MRFGHRRSLLPWLAMRFPAPGDARLSRRHIGSLNDTRSPKTPALIGEGAATWQGQSIVRCNID